MKVSSFATSLVKRILDPGLCPGCRHPLKNGHEFCAGCYHRLVKVNNPCPLCGLENHGEKGICAVCLYDPPRWQAMTAPLQYRGLTRDFLLQLKFSESLYLANSLVTSVAGHFDNAVNPPEVLLPVPLHQNRLFERGFNQAFEIARMLSARLDIKLDFKTLSRIRNTEAQAGLSASKREKNTLRAFHCEPTAYRHVAVVDDIITTGSTANEITKTLHLTGIETVEIWGLARVVKP